MERQELINALKFGDRVIRVIDKNGKFRAAAIKNTVAARTAQQRHNLPVAPAFLLARQLAAASLMASFLKGEERIIAEANGSGLIDKVFAEAIQVGEVRGFVSYDNMVDGSTFNTISDALGEGTFRITRILYDKSEPIVGIVELQRGDISTDLAFYLAQSEQIPSGVILDVDFDDSGLLKQSGGLLIQAMPGATEREIEEVYNSLRKAEPITTYLEKGMMPQDILTEILPFEFEVLKSSRVDFFCRCSKDKFMDKLKTLSSSELKEMEKHGHNELVCHYCNEHYYLSDLDFEYLIHELQAKEN